MRSAAKALRLCSLALIAAACNAMLGIDEAGPIRGSGGDASAGSSGLGGSSGATGGVGGGVGGAGGSAGSLDAGACDAEVSSDPSHCGACGHSCHGDACVGGKCVPQLVRGVDHDLDSLTLTPDQIFASANYGGAIVRIPKSDYGNAETWAVTQPGYDSFSPVAVFGQDVYFSYLEGRRIYRAGSAALGTPQVIYQDPNDDYTDDVEVDSSGVYFAICNKGIWKLTSGAPQQISQTPSCAYRIAIDADAIWATSATEGSLFRVQKAGGAVAEIVPAPPASDSYALWVEQTHVYFATYVEVGSSGAEYESRLYRVAKNAPNNSPAEGLQGGAPFATISDMTVADGFLYFVSSGTEAGAYQDGRIQRVPLTNPNQAPEVVIADRDYPLAIAVDDQFVYWIEGMGPGWGPSQIWRVAK